MLPLSYDGGSKPSSIHDVPPDAAVARLTDADGTIYTTTNSASNSARRHGPTMLPVMMLRSTWMEFRLSDVSAHSLIQTPLR